MKVLLDTNVLLDFLLARTPFNTEAGKIWRANDDDLFVGFITATTLTDVFYSSERHTKSLVKAHEAVDLCLEVFEICPVGRRTLLEAALLPGDFEDNLQVTALRLPGLMQLSPEIKASRLWASQF